MDGRWREGGLIDGWISTLTDGWLAGELHDWAGDEGCFLFVCCESGSESLVFVFESWHIVLSVSVSACVFMSTQNKHCLFAHTPDHLTYLLIWCMLMCVSGLKPGPFFSCHFTFLLKVKAHCCPKTNPNYCSAPWALYGEASWYS